MNYHLLNSSIIIGVNSTVRDGLLAIEKSSGYPVVVVDNNLRLQGILSSGDVARWLIKRDSPCLSDDIALVMNPNPTIAHHHDSVETLQALLASPLIRTLPIIDTNRYLKSVVTTDRPCLSMPSGSVGNGSSVYIVAEIGVNHNGDLDEAIFLIEAAHKAGCNCVKFQHRTNAYFCSNKFEELDLGAQYITKAIRENSLSLDELIVVCSHARNLNIDIMITPFDEQAVDEISFLDFDCVKIASCDLTNHPLILKASGLSKPIILSTGMSFEREIIQTVELMHQIRIPFGLLHCHSAYPAMLSDLNVSYISTLARICKSVVGYSSHTSSIAPILTSIGAGAQIVEIHITRSRLNIGTDHSSSIETRELPQLVELCREAYISVGSPDPRAPKQGEVLNREILGKSLCYRHNLDERHILNRDDLILASPGNGIRIEQLPDIVGRRLVRAVTSREMVAYNHLENSGLADRSIFESLGASYDLLLNRGFLLAIPVRLHDCKSIVDTMNPRAVEFHMSDTDIQLCQSEDISSYFDGQDYRHIAATVHAVEQFDDSYIFDICHEELVPDSRAWREIERLSTAVKNLSRFFLPSIRQRVVINIGGFTTDKFLDETNYKKILGFAKANLCLLASSFPEIDFAVQTMPPFPWHQGGISYHNIMTAMDRILDIARIDGISICFDVSHTALYCNYSGDSVLDYAKQLRQYISHIHMSDADGINGEGLMIGDGRVPIGELLDLFSDSSRQLTLVPEIWQGHKNGGERFARAINLLADF